MTGYSPIEENTLGVEIGKRGKPRRQPSSPAARALRQMSAGTATLGTGYLGIGFGIVAGLAGAFGIGLYLFALRLISGPDSGFDRLGAVLPHADGSGPDCHSAWGKDAGLAFYRFRRRPFDCHRS